MTPRTPSERLASRVRRILGRQRHLSSNGGRSGWRVEPMASDHVLITAKNYDDHELRGRDMERWYEALTQAGLRVQFTGWDDELDVRPPR